MKTFENSVGPETHRRLSLLAIPITSAAELLSRDTVQVANELGMSIQELEFIKLTVSAKILFTQGHTSPLSDFESRSWRALPPALPTSNLVPSSIRPLGIPSLEALLGGGLPAGSMSSFVGGSAAGKTFIVASCAAACALLGMKVLVVSAANDITPKKLQLSMEAIMKVNQNPNKPYNPQQVQDLLLFALSNIHLQHCYDVWSLMDLLSKVKDHNTFDVIAIDSLHHYIAPLCLIPGTTASALARNVSVSGAGASIAGAVSATTASEFATSLLTQVGLLLRSLTATHSSVLLTNTPEAGLRRSTTVTRTSSTSYANTSSGTEHSTGNGTASALLDLVDITVTLEKGEYDRSQSIRDLFSQSGAAVAAGASTSAPVPTVIKAVATLRPPYLKSLPSSCEFHIK